MFIAHLDLIYHYHHRSFCNIDSKYINIFHIYIKQFWKRAVKMARFRFRGTFIDVQRRTKIAFLSYMIFATSKIVSKKGKNILLCLICLIHKGNYIATDTDNSSSSLPFRFKSTFVY